MNSTIHRATHHVHTVTRAATRPADFVVTHLVHLHERHTNVSYLIIGTTCLTVSSAMSHIEPPVLKLAWECLYHGLDAYGACPLVNLFCRIIDLDKFGKDKKTHGELN